MMGNNLLAGGKGDKEKKEDKDFAVQLMDTARELIETPPPDEEGINDYLRVASGFAHIRPEIAFSMLESFAGQADEIVNASALLARYDKKNTSFRNGEMILSRGLPYIGGKVFEYGEELNLLARADIDRLRNITDKFQRNEARILLKLYIFQAFFNKKIGLSGADGLNFPGGLNF